MEATSEINKIPNALKYAHEDEDFWRKHVIAFPKSGLTKKAYCKQHKVNYPRFFYWIRKISSPLKTLPQKISCSMNQNLTTAIPPLLPVQLKQELSHLNQGIHCALSLKNGCTLNIFNEQSLLFILEKWS